MPKINMKNKDWTIKLFEKEEYLAIEELRGYFNGNQNYWSKRSIKSSYYKWKFKDNYINRGILLVTIFRKKIIGMISITYRKVLLNGIELLVGELGDAFIRAEYNRKGMFRSLLKESKDVAFENDCKFIYGTPNKRALPGEIKAGYRIIPGLKIKNLVLPLDLESIIKKRYGISHFGWLVGCLLNLFNLFKSMFLRSNFKNKIHIKRFFDFPDEIDDLFERCHSDYDWIVIRDKKYLNWRFNRNPDIYSNYLIIQDKNIIGYFVTKICDNRGLKFGYIADYLIDKNFRKYEADFKNIFTNLFKKQDVALVSIWINKQNFMYKIFKKSGFLNFKTIPIIIYKNQLENIKRKKNFKWHFTLADSDNI